MPRTSAPASMNRRLTSAQPAVSTTAMTAAASDPSCVRTLATLTSWSMLSRFATSAAQRSMRGSPGCWTMSPSSKNENEPTASSASSVVSSRPRLPGVRRSAEKRAGTWAGGAAAVAVGGGRRGAADQPPGGPRELDQRPPAAPVGALVQPRGDLGARLGVAPEPDQRDDRRDHHHERPEREQAAADVGGELVDRAPEHVAEHAERGRPRAGREHVVGQEAPERHLRRAGDERRDRPHEAEEAADEDRRAAALLEEALDLVEPLVGDLQPRAVLDQPLAAEVGAELVGGHVAEHGARPHDRDQRQQ